VPPCAAIPPTTLTREVLDFLVDQTGARARWELMSTGRSDGYHVPARERRRIGTAECL